MAAPKNEVTQFTSSWNKTAAWAQSQGYSKNDYYPVYQMDSKRLLSGEQPMSNAERTRAIQAAANPNKVTPTPGNTPDPTNVLGNAVSDARNIFTGLAPNHLVANLFDTVKNTIVHPSTVIKPIEDVVGGVVSGNMSQVKQGLELGAGLTGPGSILSWLPGVYVAGEVAQGGIGEALSHPVVSFLDVAPFADSGAIITAAADESRVATLAARLGKTPDELRDMSLPGMAKAYAFNTKVANLPDFISDRAPALLDPITGKPLTIGGALDSWITNHTGMGKTFSALMKGMLVVNQHKTDEELALYAPAQTSLQALKTDAERNRVFEAIMGTDPETKGKSQAEIRNDDNLDYATRTAIDLNLEPLYWQREMSVATGATVPVARLDGSIGLIHSAGEKSPVVSARNEFDQARADLLKDMAPSHRLSGEAHQLDTRAAEVQTRIDRTATLAKADAEALEGKNRYLNVPLESGKRAKVVALDLRRQARELFGTADDARRQGIVYEAEQAVREKDWATAKTLSAAAMRRLERSGVGSLDADLSPALTELKGQMMEMHAIATKQIDFANRFAKEFEKSGKFGNAKGSFAKYLTAERKFAAAVRDHPTGEWVDVVKEKFIQGLLDQEDRYHRLEDFSQALKTRGMAQDRIDRLRQDPTKFAQLMVLSIRSLGNNPFGDSILKPEEEQAMWKSAISEANKVRESGETVQWLPRVTSLDIRDTDPGRYGVHLASTGKERRSTRAFARKMDITAQRDDVVAALHQAGKEQLQIDGTIEFAETHLSPHMVTGSAMLDQITKGATGLDDVYERYLAEGSNPTDAVERIMRENFKMVRFNPQDYFGFSLPRWGADTQYIPKAIADALPKMLDRGQFPLDTVYQKATGLFRFSILKMSPRYTAHVLFGGTFLLALRSSPGLVRAIPDAIKIMRNQGDVPRATFERTAAQFGIDPVEYQTLNAASKVYHTRGGASLAKLNAQENIEKVQKVPLSEAKAVHWLKAVGDLNYKFTNYVSSFQRAAAYVDYLNGPAKKIFRDPVEGETIGMTRDRAEAAAMQHVYKVMGDLQAMSPLERNSFTTILPFYGWTKHILKFVGSYPEDHPFRASVLSVMATQNSDDIASGLPKRLQFLFFLGSPDAQGNVSAIDVRSFDPLRDVANYATLGGWISSLNPVLTAPLAVIDPQIIFGGNTLYPTVTYDQFYGIETAGSQGSPITAVEQFVPQVSALESALQESGSLKQLATTNPNAFAKGIYESLEIPFAQVQHINLKQIAAKDEIDRYHVASQAASNAFDTGNFSQIKGLADVPDPLNVDYDVSPGALQGLYQQLLTEYPGQAPSETALPPPTPTI